MSAIESRPPRRRFGPVQRWAPLAVAILGSATACAVPNGAGASPLEPPSTTESVSIATATVLMSPPVPQAFGTTGGTTTWSKLPSADAISLALAGVDKDLFVSATLDGSTFRATVRASSVSNGRADLALWEAFLVQGAVADRLSVAGDNLRSVVNDSDISVATPDGSIVDHVAGGAGDIVAGQTLDGNGQPADRLVALAENVAIQYGLTVERAQVLHPLRPALEIIATEPKPGTVTNESLPDLMNALAGSPVDLDGVYLEIDLPDGTAVTRQGYAYRSGAGMNWANPDPSIGIGVPHGGPPGG